MTALKLEYLWSVSKLLWKNKSVHTWSSLENLPIVWVCCMSTTSWLDIVDYCGKLSKAVVFKPEQPIHAINCCCVPRSSHFQRSQKPNFCIILKCSSVSKNVKWLCKQNISTDQIRPINHLFSVLALFSWYTLQLTRRNCNWPVSFSLALNLILNHILRFLVSQCCKCFCY